MENLAPWISIPKIAQLQIHIQIYLQACNISNTRY